MDRQIWDAAVIGGGAAGLAAAAFLGRAGHRVLLLEKGPRVGKKLLATGNGTCNLSNRQATAVHYHGQDPAFVQPSFERFSPADAVEFFTSIGVDCQIRKDGRIYPLAVQAAAVLDGLRLECRARGVEERCGAAVTQIQPRGGGFLIRLSAGSPVETRRVLVCTGGAAAPALGGGTDGYGLLTALGHTRTPLFPSIVQVRTDPTFLRAMKGIRIDGALEFRLDGRPLARETGEILFTEYGLSGPAVMQISRPVADWERRKQGAMTAVLNLLPEWEPDRLARRLADRRSLPGRTLEDLLTGLLHKRVGQTVLRASGVGPLTRPAASLTNDELRTVAAGIQAWSIPVTGTQGMGGAQVTAGGISTKEFLPQTLESRRIPGLYAAGEVLDIDGDCGGFNLQWAWSSAYAAAQAISRSLIRPKGDTL